MRYGATATNLLEKVAFFTNQVPLPILDAMLGPVQARVLVVACRLRVLDRLAAGRATCEQLASELQVDPSGLALVLRVLEGMGYVRRGWGRAWSLSKQGKRYFGGRTRQAYNSFIESGPPQWRMFDHLEEVLRTGKGIDFHESLTPAEWDLYQRAMLENASDFAWFLVSQLPIRQGATRCLDLGGGHGFVGAALCRRYPGMHATVLDLKEAVTAAQSLARSRAFGGTVSYIEGNLLHDEFGDGFDVTILCNVLHHFSPDANRDILRRVKKSLRPGGVVGIFDIEPPHDRAPPEAAADACALLFRVTSTSNCFRGPEYLTWLRDAGFRETRIARSLRLPSRMLAFAQAPD